MKWYEQKFVNHAEWVMANLEYLNLTTNEALLVLMVIFLQSKNSVINYEILAEKLHVNTEQIDQLFTQLLHKKVLSVSMKRGVLSFDLTHLYQTNIDLIAAGEKEPEIYQIFEQVFKRPLTSVEMQKIGQWIQKETRDDLLNALKYASMYSKVITIAQVEKYLEKKRIRHE